jgi:Mrp family chromosome partitioning ATPase
MKDGRRPLLIDGDERMQGLTRLAGITDHPSPNGRIGHGYEWPITTDETIDFIAARAAASVGTSPATSAPASSARRSGPITDHRELVLIDAPPVMSASETADLASQADGVVLVVDRGTPLRHLEDARDRIALSGTPIIGYVFNRADIGGSNYYPYGYAAKALKKVDEPA